MNELNEIHVFELVLPHLTILITRQDKGQDFDHFKFLLPIQRLRKKNVSLSLLFI